MLRASILLGLATITGCHTAGAETESADTSVTDPSATTTDPLTSAAPSTSGGPATSGGPMTSGGPTSSSDASTGDDSAASSSTSAGVVTSGSDAGDTTDTSDGSDATTTGESTGGVDTGDVWMPEGCPVIYAQDLLPTFELELDPEDLAAIEAEWVALNDEDQAEHPLALFRYEDIVITNASVRLRGSASHWATQGKMQFEVSFNTYDETGRFMGLKHVLFDAAEYNRSFLRDRLALAILRDVGLPAPCANNARLVLNGEYYGLFTSIEKVDSEFLERYFEEPNGNLYKRAGGTPGWKLKNNEEDPDKSDIQALNAADTVEELLAVMNLEESILEWATEAVLPDRDGLWGGGLNGYTYNDPKTGFNMIPWDLDDSFTRLEPDVDPVTWKKPPEVFHGRPYYDIALADPAWFQEYIEAIEFVLVHGYDVGILQDRIDTWAEQIATAVEEDPNRPFTLAQHLDKVDEKREFVADRAAFLADWLECWQDGGTNENNDGVCVPP